MCKKPAQDKDALFYCWTTREVIGLYSANTLNLLRNEKKKIPLNNVDGTTQRLSVKYSLLVRQYALNEGAYNYWNDKRVVLGESGGLYTSQPSQLISNIRNVNDPEENVLGYFWASSVSEKRIFTRRPPGMRVNMMDCELISIDSIDFAAVIYPLHMVILDEERWVLTNYCADCLYKGETNIKPDFWEDK